MASTGQVRPARIFTATIMILLTSTAMVLAGDRLLFAGPPDVIEEDDPYGAFEGRKGGRLNDEEETNQNDDPFYFAICTICTISR